MLDIHTHLYMSQYDDDRTEVIKRAFDAGLSMMISVSTTPEDHGKAITIAEMDERIFASVGLHPHYFNEQLSIHNKQATHNAEQLTRDIIELRNLTKAYSKVIAIGECGLDYFSRTDDPVTDMQKAWQKEGFLAQIELAQELRLPMIIHCRPSLGSQDAYEDMAEILKQKAFDMKCILHCYMGDTEVTQKFLALSHVFFSFTGNITYPVKKSAEGTADDIRETVKLIPLERMFTETDCPFLAPVPYRGKRNEPQFVAEVTKKISDIKGISSELVFETMRANFDRVFVFEKSVVE